MNNSQIIAAFIALFGIGLGSAFAGFGYLWRVKSEERKKRKIVLFNLLEIFNCIRISRMDSTKITNEYFDIVKKIYRKLFNIELEEQPDELYDFFHSFVSKLIAERNHSSIVHLSETYKKCINDLSEQSPVLAFKLNGREKLNSTLSQLDEYNQTFASLFKENKDNFKLVSSLQLSVKNEVIEDILKDLIKDIYSVAIRISPIILIQTYLQLRKTINKPQSLETREFEQKMESYFKLYAEKVNLQTTEESG